MECLIPEIRLVSGDYVVIVEAGTASGDEWGIRDSVSDATQVRVGLGTYLNYPGLTRNQGYIAQRTHWENQPGMELRS